MSRLTPLQHGNSEQPISVGGCRFGDFFFGFLAQFRNDAQHVREQRWFVTLAAMVSVRLVRRVGFQQQEFDRHRRDDAAQPLRAIVGDRAADAEAEAELPEVFGLLLAAGKAVHHAAQSADAT